MGETIALVAIIGSACFFGGRTIYRSLTGKSERCGCGKECPLSDTCSDSKKKKD
ncbi:MAG: hypothetical protein HYS25_14385 [Ignavibacteriales bacterium]|nr:hypothetical protein [Ignavibacteriales bacterium]